MQLGGPDGRTATNHTIFAEGWLNSDGSSWGRPVGLLRLPDGSMLVADDTAAVVYRIAYGEAPPPTSSAAARSFSTAAAAAALLAAACVL